MQHATLQLVAAVVSLLLALGPRAATADESRITVDASKAAAAGIRRLPPAKRLILYTDLPPSPEIERLPGLFDQAFPQWCEYFHVAEAEHADWQLTGFLMKDKARFVEAGLWPAGGLEFGNGYSVGYDFWLFDQKTDYYRRHLMLHEGTHSFMRTLLGSLGPPWYAEGMAELMGTHRLDGDRLTLNYMPAGREEVPGGNRIRLIKDAVAARHAMRLPAVLAYSDTAHRAVEPYAWCWAAAVLLDRHPAYRDRFRRLYKHVAEADFTDQFREAFADDWQTLNEEWAVYVTGLEYGYDVPRSAIDFTPGRVCPAEGATVQVAADHGWQNSGSRLSKGINYRLIASGRYRVGTRPQTIESEPGGISIRYYQGRPLGMLLAAVRPDNPPENTPSALLISIPVGLGATIQPEAAGTLFFKINHSAAELRDNEGTLTVRVRAADD